ncbi:MAG: hypothetical protein ACI4I9_05020 [Porcipelethomonas sp.]
MKIIKTVSGMYRKRFCFYAAVLQGGFLQKENHALGNAWLKIKDIEGELRIVIKNNYLFFLIHD